MNRRQFINHTALALVASHLIACSNEKKFKLKKDMVIGCFGDSITHAGGRGYVEMLQAKFDKERPDLNLRFLNFGKSSETVTGLTEEDHPGPRPYLFERLDEILATNKIDLALFCYGINCGIYGKPSEKLLKSFKIGVYSFLEKLRQKQIGAILLTPPPLALEAAPLPHLSDDVPYGYKNPYPKYETEVLMKFKEIVLTMQHPVSKLEIDIHTPLLEKQQVCYDSDPIHPNPIGHQLMADTIFRSLTF
ncbi:SGNH/GDSL hydrolase family protein [Pseudozobellia thermophila]|uniref:Lysophospholipase L1 n=1 Tax=Pseudozobellia thermophila TaxID=192903 RepID=A0A1M6ADF9_9FLAO|nr:GDSL-type esterase/lipase family protein [Pseudozobellia thermophila]SHI34566.1 Lysophospholipase L1 [Pseudozobellia thermophila]